MRVLTPSLTKDYRVGWLFAAMVALPLFGCERAAVKEAKEQEESRLRPIAIMLGKYSRDFRGKPADEEAFKKYLENDPQAQRLMEKAGAATVDEFLTSTRDGQKFVIIYRGMENKVQGDIWGYEAEGVDGRRVVVDSLSVAQTLPEEEFRRLVPNP